MRLLPLVFAIISATAATADDFVPEQINRPLDINRPRRSFGLGSGQALVRGRIWSSDSTVAMPRLLTIQNDDIFTRMTSNTKIEVMPDGTFQGIIYLPHAADTDISPLPGTHLILPGDTLTLNVDIARPDSIARESYRRLQQTADSVDINPYFSPSWSSDRANSYVRSMTEAMARLLGDNDSVLSDPADEMRRLEPVSMALAYILEARLRYDEKQFKTEYDSTNNISIVTETDSDFVKMDMTPVYELLRRYPNSTVNNPAMIMAGGYADLIVNRMEYSEFRPLLHCDNDSARAAALKQIEERTGISAESLLAEIITSRHATTDVAGPDSIEVPESLKQLLQPFAGSGKSLFVDFWGLGCGPCYGSMIAQRSLIDEFAEKPVEFVYVCPHKEKYHDEARQWLAENGIRGEHLYAGDEQWRELKVDLRFRGIPFSIMVSPDMSTYRTVEGQFIAGLRQLLESY